MGMKSNLRQDAALSVCVGGPSVSVLLLVVNE